MARLAARRNMVSHSRPARRLVPICLTNDTYLLAGIPLYERYPAQRQLAPQLGSAARLVELDDVDKMADILDDLAMNVTSLTAAKREALRPTTTRLIGIRKKNTSCKVSTHTRFIGLLFGHFIKSETQQILSNVKRRAPRCLGAPFRSAGNPICP